LKVKNVTVKVSRKKATLAIVVVAMAAAVAGALIAYPTFAVSSQASQQSQATPQMQDTNFTLNDAGLKSLQEFLSTGDMPAIAHNITATARGWAFQRVDNETIKQYAVEMNLTLQLGSKKGNTISIVNVTGSVSVNSTTYNAVFQIESGKGVIETNKNIVLVSAEGVNDGTTVTLKAEATYFWWGGKAFAFRGRALLQQTSEKPMLLLLRYGLAKVQ
jgi:archaellum component FlaG (FlaF/FlaG flagellin family)